MQEEHARRSAADDNPPSESTPAAASADEDEEAQLAAALALSQGEDVTMGDEEEDEIQEAIRLNDTNNNNNRKDSWTLYVYAWATSCFPLVHTFILTVTPIMPQTPSWPPLWTPHASAVKHVIFHVKYPSTFTREIVHPGASPAMNRI